MAPPPAPPGFKKASATAKVLAAIGPTYKKHKKHAESEEEPPATGEEVWLLSYSDLMTLLFGFFVILFSMSTLDKTKYESLRKATAEQFGGEYQLPTEALKREVDAGLKAAGLSDKDVKITQTVEGMELNFRGQAFFASGSADLSGEAKSFILKTIEGIKKTGDDYIIRVEGHTDDAPINTPQFPSNWELSSLRATSVVRVLEDNGIDLRRLEAIGYGASRPIKPNRDANNEPILPNMAENRRIVIKIRKADKAELDRLPANKSTGKSKLL